MTLYDFLNEADENDEKDTGTGENKTKENKDSSDKDLNSFIDDICANKKWEEFVKSIGKISSGQNVTGFTVNNIPVYFKNNASGKASDQFVEIANKINKACNGKIEDTLKNVARKNEDSKIENFILSTLIPYLQNPDKIKSNNGTKSVVEPEYYRDIGKALVFRSSAFVSKLATSKTEIDSATFNQLMIDAFNDKSHGGDNQNFLAQFTSIDQKMRLDAAKKTVAQVETNGKKETDGEQKFGSKSSENESQILYSVLPYIFESNIELPRSVSQFSDNAKTAIKQTEMVEKAWPQQFKTWFDKYQSAFENGVKEGQDEVRKDDSKEVKDPLTGKSLPGRKGWGTGGPNAFIRDNKYLSKLTDKIKGQQTTIFNLGTKMVLGLFDMMEHGGKILQGIKDEFGSAVADIKKSFNSSSSVKDFEKQTDELTENQQYAEAAAVAQAGAVVSFEQLLEAMQNGPIGKINFDEHTFSTSMSNSQSTIEVAVQNLLATLDKYTDAEKRFEENKDVNVSDGQMDSVIQDKKTDNNTQGDDKQKEEPKEVEDNDENNKQESIKFIPSLRNFLLTEDDNDDESGSAEKVDDDDESKADPIDKQNATLSGLELVKDSFDSNVDKNRLKDIVAMLKKFKGDNKNVVKSKDGKIPDFTNLDKYINLYNMIIDDDLKFNMNAADLKSFLDGIKSYINDFKEMPAIENLPVYIDSNDKKWPAMETEGTLTKETSSEDVGSEFAKVTEEFQNKLINEYISKLKENAEQSKDDSWLDAYAKKKENLKSFAEEYYNKILESYKDNTPEWVKPYFAEVTDKNYLQQLYMLMALMTNFRLKLQKDTPEKEESVIFNNFSNIIFENDNQDNDSNSNENNEDKNATGPTNDDHGQKNTDTSKKEHTVEYLGKLLNNINLNSDLLGTKWDADEYKQNDPVNINKFANSIATRASGFSMKNPNDGNGIIPVVMSLIAAKDSPTAKSNLEKIKGKCGKMCKLFTEGIEGQRNTDKADLYLYYGCAYAIYHCLSANPNVDQDADNKLQRQGTEQVRPADSNNNSEDQSNQENNQENPTKSDSVQYPNVSPDSFLNEIYKYIRG